jgi:hypothetical protein
LASRPTRSLRPCACCLIPMHSFGGSPATRRSPSQRARRLPTRGTRYLSVPLPPGRSRPSIDWGGCPAAIVAADIVAAAASPGFVELPINIRDGQTAGALPAIHKDPFERMLIAHAIAADMVIAQTRLCSTLMRSPASGDAPGHGPGSDGQPGASPGFRTGDWFMLAGSDRDLIFGMDAWLSC